MRTNRVRRSFPTREQIPFGLFSSVAPTAFVFRESLMHIMFIHPNFPAQFGHIAHHLAVTKGWKCTVVTSIDTTALKLPFVHINYKVNPSQAQPKVFYNPD